MTTEWTLGVRWRAGARLGLAAGVVAIALGLALLARDGLVDIVSQDALVDSVALTTLATGCFRLVGAFEVEERTGHRLTIGGLILRSVDVCLGAVLLLTRDAEASTLRTTIGVWGLVAGVLLVVQGIRMLRVRRAIG